MSRKNRINRFATRTQKTLLPLVAVGVGGSLAALPADAIELGDLTVQSRLGHPLRASIAFVLAPNEQISDSCVSAGLGRATGGLPGTGPTRISVGNGVLLLEGKTPIREPMIATTIVIDCPYTANLSREYMMFIDPVALAEQPTTQTTAPPQSAPLAVARPARAARAVNREPIDSTTRYQVQPGDSLSVITQRIENRSIPLWPAVNAIFAANPDAFMDNDPNKLKAGSWLTIPSFDGSEPAISASAPAAEPETGTPAGSVAYEAPEAETALASEPAPVEELEPQVVVDLVEPVGDTSADTTTDLRPGDIIIDGDDAFAATGGEKTETVMIPDTELDGPVTESASPNVPVAVITTPAIGQPSSPSWLIWFAGGGIAIILALLAFGRRLSGRFEPTPLDSPADQPMRRASDGDTTKLEAIVADDYDLDDDSPTAENLALDADLFVGTGLEAGTDMEVAEDFGFAAPTQVDIELPFEPEATVETMQTDIISPARTDEQSILDSEVLPGDDDYDMSVIVDATKMPQPEDVTQRDLRAVEVDLADDTQATDNYTIDREAVFDVLEQDYEDEMTATQALNQEIARAAEELAGRMDQETVDATHEMPLATVTELDVTAQLQAQDNEARDPDATSENEANTVNIAAEDKTAEMPLAGNDDTAEMEVEGGKVDTKIG